jgi:signal peptidase I
MSTTTPPLLLQKNSLQIPALAVFPESWPQVASARPAALGATPAGAPPAGGASAVRARRRRRRPARVALEALTTLGLIAGVALFLAIGVLPHVFGYRPVTMLSGSMTPTIRPGDVAIDTPEPLSAVRVGQIVTFHTPIATRYVDSHRVVRVRRLPGGAIAIRTKGDANAVEDPWTAELHGHTAWRVRLVVPRLGYLINALRGPVLHAALLWIVPLVLVGWLLAGIWRRKDASGGRAGEDAGAARPSEARAS